VTRPRWPFGMVVGREDGVEGAEAGAVVGAELAA
jgi:hypothetical protein